MVRPVRLWLCAVTSVASRGVDAPYAVVGPYSIRELAVWSVVHAIVAVVPVIAEAATALIAGLATVAKLNKAFPDALATPKVKQLFASQGLEPAPSNTPEQLGKYIGAQVTKWSSVVKQSGAQLD